MSTPMDTGTVGSARPPEAAGGAAESEPVVGDEAANAESSAAPPAENRAIAEGVAASESVAVGESVAVAESGTAVAAEGLDEPAAESLVTTSAETAAIADGNVATVAPEPVATADVLPFPTPGQRLRAARAARELGVQQITDTLHIEPRLIAAMESDDFAAFDAPVYARGFLRKYADFLGVPVAEVLAGYERLHAGPSAPSLVPTAGAETSPRDWSALKLPVMVAGVLVLVVGGSAWWWMHRARDAAATRVDASVSVPAAPVAAGAAEGAPASADATTGLAAGGAPLDESLPGAAGIASGAVGTTPPDGSRPVPAPGVARTTLPASAAGPTPARPSAAALEIDFVGDCWVEVTGSTGARLMYDLGRPGESRALPGPGPWRVFLGAADGARLRVSGRPVVVPAARRSGNTARLVVGPDGTVQ